MTVSFYPYRSVQAKIWKRNGSLSLRMSEVLRDMPESLQYALALVLVGKYERKPYPKTEEQRLDEYIDSEKIRARMEEQAKDRPHQPRLYGTAGEKFDLVDVFESVNREYFAGEFPKPRLSWTRTHSRLRMGYADTAQNAVFISKSLDKRRVPRYVIEFIMYHELLHFIHPSEKQGSRCLHHTKSFREAEQQFKQYKKAKAWMGYR